MAAHRVCMPFRAHILIHYDSLTVFPRYCGLGRTVTALGLGTEEDIELDYVCSSIGAVKLDLLAALYHAAQGDSGTKELEARAARAKRSKDVTASAVDPLDLARIRVYFPSCDTVIRSRGGSNVSLRIEPQRLG